MTKEDIVKWILEGRSSVVGDVGRAYAPANIALVKYWGKRDKALNLPRTGSLSISLAAHGTETVIRCGEVEDRLVLNGEVVALDHAIAVRLFLFLNLFRPSDDFFFEVVSESRIPIGAGLASSASGFASMVLAVNDLFGWGLSADELSVLARMGSGSASRSLFHGFVEWREGEREDGMDSFAALLPMRWPDLRVGLVPICKEEKPIGSTDAMNRTVDESLLYGAWPATVARDLVDMRGALESGDFSRLGAVAEGNALTMHATMLGCRPAICYWLPESMAALHRVWALRREGVEVYATIDAGPNIKVLFESSCEEAVLGVFPALTVIDPFGFSA